MNRNPKSLVIAIVLLAVGALAIFALLFWLTYGTQENSAVPSATATVEPVVTVSLPPLTETPLPEITLEPTPTPTALITGPFYYTVVAGDSLSGIAARFNVTVDAIIALNNLASDVIYTGQTLIVPAGAPSGDSGGLAANEYRVAEGDSLESIAAARNVTGQQLRNANFMYGDSILPGQKLYLPDENTQPLTFNWSELEGNRTLAYPIFYEAGDFTLRYQQNSFPSVDADAVVTLVRNALANAENLWGVDLTGSFTVYAAGTLFKPDNQHLRGRSFSAARESLFLYDGTGDPADQQYIIAHELTHLYMWNVFGVPSSVMISEGAAVYSGMNTIKNSDHLPLKSICKLLYDAGALPNIASELGYSGHNYDMDNYYTAGCFVGYLVEAYNPASIGLVYPNSNYANVYGKKLDQLEKDFELSLSWQQAVAGVDPAAFSAQLAAVSDAYRIFFPAFSPTSANLEKYRLLDHARLELLKGNITASQDYLAQIP